jgi:serine/threonine protein kinase
MFTVVPPVALAPLLPHLPSTTLTPPQTEVEIGARGPSGDDTAFRPTPLDLISRFLVYPPENRLLIADALSHPWFPDNILLPEGLSSEIGPQKQSVSEWEGNTLAQWLQFILTGTADVKS